MCNPPGHRTTTFVVDLREKSCETASWGWLTSFFPSSQSPYIAVIRPSHLPLVSAAMEAKLGCHGSEERSPPCLTRDPEGLHLQLSSATWPSHPPPQASAGPALPLLPQGLLSLARGCEVATEGLPLIRLLGLWLRIVVLNVLYSLSHSSLRIMNPVQIHRLFAEIWKAEACAEGRDPGPSRPQGR